MNINNDNVKASKSDNKTKNLIISSNFDQICVNQVRIKPYQKE